MVNLGSLLQELGDVHAWEKMYRRAVDAGDEEARERLDHLHAVAHTPQMPG